MSIEEEAIKKANELQRTLGALPKTDEMTKEALKLLKDDMENSVRESLRRYENPLRDLPHFRGNSELQMDRMDDIARSITSGPELHAQNVQQAIRSHISELQRELKHDEELLIYHGTGLEFIRVLKIGFPNEHVLILVGHDGDGNPASAVVSMTGVNLTCKIVKVEPPRKPNRIGFLSPSHDLT